MDKVFIIGEIGINHSGSLDIAKKLIDGAKDAGCDAVKFQKRTVEKVYSPEELDKYRESPFGTTNREQKNGIEFGKAEFDIIDAYCKEKNIEWFASAWDLESQDFLKQYNLKYNKIASSMLTITPLVEKVAKERKYTFISTGMSDLREIAKAASVFEKYNCPFELMHCVSTYPMSDEVANLNVIKSLRKTFKCKVGYSGHEQGIQISLAAVALGATSVERHFTLDRAAYGSDQSASLELPGLKTLVRDIRIIEKALGDGEKRILKDEIAIKEKLANPFWYKKGKK